MQSVEDLKTFYEEGARPDPARVITNVWSPERCSTIFSTSLWALRNDCIFEYEVDWRKVRDGGTLHDKDLESFVPNEFLVGAVGVISSRCQGKVERLVISVPSKETADKIAKAFKFLIKSSDQTRGTGFE